MTPYFDVLHSVAYFKVTVCILVKCGCSKERCSTNRCQCQRAGLLCTDLRSCSDDSECKNQHDDNQYQYDEDEGDEDECSDE